MAIATLATSKIDTFMARGSLSGLAGRPTAVSGRTVRSMVLGLKFTQTEALTQASLSTENVTAMANTSGSAGKYMKEISRTIKFMEKVS